MAGGPCSCCAVRWRAAAAARDARSCLPAAPFLPLVARAPGGCGLGSRPLPGKDLWEIVRSSHLPSFLSVTLAAGEWLTHTCLLLQLRGAAGAEPCPIAQGGQAGRPAAAAQPPLVSFVLLPSTDDRLAAETLAQLFYTAHEAPSAEFIVVEPLGAAQTANSSSGDGSSSASGGRLAATYSLLSALCSHLRASFGAELRVLDTAQRSGAEAGQQPAAGQWADAQVGGWMGQPKACYLFPVVPCKPSLHSRIYGCRLG